MLKIVNWSVKKVFSDILYLLLAISLALNLLFIYYLVFRQTTTFEVFFSSNTPFYNWLSISLTLITSILFGVAVSMTLFIWRQRKVNAALTGGNSLFAAVFGAISAGCPVCGAWLLPMLGIAGSLAAFPFQGLEIKVLSIFLLSYSINESAKSITGVCQASKSKILSWNDQYFIFNFNRETLTQFKPLVVVISSVLLIYILPNLPQKYKVSFAKKGNLTTNSVPAPLPSSNIDSQSLFAQVNPREGYTINASYGDIGPKLLQSGVIDLGKFKSIYEQADTPLTDEQLTILTKGVDRKITINKENSYFLINFFWALGLANKNPILDQGEITKYGQSQIGSFASTGGWSVGTKEVMDIYSKSKIIELSPSQQEKVDEVASNTYRPCCGNSTAFPDCNHGMALLAVLELLASNDASTSEMYRAAKYFNAFWFPQQYLDIATYFKAKEGKDFADVDAKLIVSQEFSSGQGWSKTKKWLASNNLVEKAPSGGGGCGV